MCHIFEIYAVIQKVISALFKLKSYGIEHKYFLFVSNCRLAVASGF